MQTAQVRKSEQYLIPNITAIEKSAAPDQWLLSMSDGTFGEIIYCSPWLNMRVPIKKYRMGKLSKKQLCKILLQLMRDNKTLPRGFRFEITGKMHCFICANKLINVVEKQREELCKDVGNFASELTEVSYVDENPISFEALAQLCVEAVSDTTVNESGITTPVQVSSGVFHAQIVAMKNAQIRMYVSVYGSEHIDEMPLINRLAVSVFLLSAPIKLVRPIFDSELKQIIFEAIVDADVLGIIQGLSALSVACEHIAEETILLIENEQLARNSLRIFQS